jgi:biopolymer transport protein TolR
MGVGGIGKGKLASEINVTPLVDVMLVLLVIFMITAPMMNTGVDIDLPDTAGQVLEDPEGKLILSIQENRVIKLGEMIIPWAELQEKLAANERVRREQELWIEGAATLPYQVVVTAMDAAKKAGVRKVQLLTDPTAILDVADLDKQAKAAKTKESPAKK